MSCLGITRKLDSIAALANSSPNAFFITNSGIENIVGRDKTFPNVFVKPAFVIGLCDTAFDWTYDKFICNCI